jgi:hypothetical protein
MAARFLKFCRKTLLVFLILAVLFPTLAKPAMSFFTPHLSYPYQYWNAVYEMEEEMNLQSFVNEALKATIMSIVTPIIGCHSCEGGPWEKQWVGTAIGMTGLAFGAVYANPPASGVDYLAYLGEKINIVPQAYAQGGVGFERMRHFLPVWEAFRNLAYAFLVIIIVFVGFAIMFRVKISPQAIISLQSALPKIILSLILITFSYAIVGFMIDIMMLVSNLIISVFHSIEIEYFGMTLLDIIFLVTSSLLASQWSAKEAFFGISYMSVRLQACLASLFW